ncbi:CPBP family intramembrane metalloprotease [Mycobacterium sp. ENV421]|uniref:CPBP family intramembrane glutamic endopeptidase n=1 Tax=unclassified Mycobacterium TaxID=2642494 RepID=UPI000C9B6FB7|nr:CPBP family intramembrane glutamic endopeptidase [Mycobacterium sp. ENV421]PND55245.1 CPBP family intramembrane metalloprotease [Mycobacterium sp. ENV421]
MTMLAELRSVASNVAVPHQEWPSAIRRRRIAVCVVLVLGALLLGLSLTRRPGDAAFYWLTMALAATWAFGARASGPVHLGCIRWRGRNQRPVITGLAIGLLLGGIFVLGGLVTREIPPVAEAITRVLEYANHGSLLLIVVITLVNGLAEEMFFRGALYTALGAFHPVVISTVLYTIATCASGNWMLGFAAIILGTVCALERRATGGVLAPVLTHVVWGLIMVLALPPMFGIWH